MSPTLHPGDFLWARRPASFQRGQIVVFRQGEERLIKRIVGLPQDTVEIRQQTVWINGSPFDEPYVSKHASLQPEANQSWTLSTDTYFVLGDARDDSLDSRRLGPIHAHDILAIAGRRLWPFPMKRFLALIVSLGVAGSLYAADSAPLLAFVIDNRMTLALGKFEPGHGWVQSTDFYKPPEPGDSVSLYTPKGKIAAVTIQENRKAFKEGTFAGWTADLSRWDNRVDPYALAMTGGQTLPAGDALVPIPSEDPDTLSILSTYLKSKGLHVDQPTLTQAFGIPFSGDIQEEEILVAHSDDVAMSKEKEANVYAVALLCWSDHGKKKVLALASQTSFKPAGRTREDHEALYGTRDFLRLLTAVDVDGDGKKEIFLYRSKEDAIQVDVFSFNGYRVRKVLSAYKPDYN